MPDIFDWVGGGVLPIFMVIVVVVLILLGAAMSLRWFGRLI